MKIANVKIKNFRNIKSVEYDFADLNAIVGKNHIGKTNTLQAIYWTLTDTLINNSSDSASVKPIDNSRALVSVELTFDNNFKFEKRYYENWTRTSGSGIETLKSHTTEYYINGISIKTTKEAIKTLKGMLLGEYADKEYKIDLIKTMINPLYLFNDEDWKNARSFIVELAGSVKDEDVFNEHPELIKIKKYISNCFGKTEVLAKSLNDTKKNLEKSISEQDGVIRVMTEKIDSIPLTDDEILNAQNQKQAIAESRTQLKNGNTETDEIKSLRERVSSKTQEIDKLRDEMLSEEKKLFADYTSSMEKARNEVAKCQNQVNELNKSIDSLKHSADIAKEKIDFAKLNLKQREERREELAEEYRKVQSSVLEFSVDAECPTCHQPISTKSASEMLDEFEKDKKEKLKNIADKGLANKTEIERLKLEIGELEEKARKDSTIEIDQLQKELSKASKKLAEKTEFLNAIEPKKSNLRTSIQILDEELANLKESLRQAEFASNYGIEKRLEEFDNQHREETAKLDAIITGGVVLDDALKTKEKAINTRHKFQLELAENEEKKQLLTLFNKYKLEMINESTKKVFPDIDFVLIENNLKEGSFNEVCYPLIKGKKTPFKKGSNSERILTGIAIIEDIRNYLGLINIPIIFDEGETLDSQSFAEINTTAQIITSIVRDGYEKPECKTSTRQTSI